MNIETQLHVEIDEEFVALSQIEKGSDQYKVVVDGLTKLLDRAIELEKIDIDERDRAETRKREEDLKLKQMAEHRKDRLIDNCMTGAGIVLPILVTIWGTVKSIEFEKEGTITTIMGRGFIQKLLPKK